MKGFKFYLTFPSYTAKRNGKKSNDYQGHSGNIIATFGTQNHNGHIDCFAPYFFYPNSPVEFTTVHTDFLERHTKRVSEDFARKIHPKLFIRLKD